jgi:hypothetical protein
MTEHDRNFSAARLAEYRRACVDASSDDVLLVPGIEYSDPENRVHVLVWGKVPFLGENLETTALLTAVAAEGGVAVLAHPARKQAWETYRHEWSAMLRGIEVWNRKTDGWAPSESGLKLAQQTGAVPFVGVDFHDRRQFFPLAMNLAISEPVTEAAVIDCLRSGSVGPMAFGRPALEFSQGGRRFVMAAAERWRRSAAPFVRARKRTIGKGPA